jgi:hypothetical protein
LTDGAAGFLPGVALGCLGILARWTDELSRPALERYPTCIRDPVALAADRLAASLYSLVPRSRKTCADEARDCVAIDPVDEHKKFLGGTVRTVGEQFQRAAPDPAETMLLRGNSHETKPQMGSDERSAKNLTETARITVWNRNVSEPLPHRGGIPPTPNCNGEPIV